MQEEPLLSGSSSKFLGAQPLIVKFNQKTLESHSQENGEVDDKYESLGYFLNKIGILKYILPSDTFKGKTCNIPSPKDSASTKIMPEE